MNKQVLFCVETVRSANTDYKYINSVINHYYDLRDRKTSYRTIYLEGKGNYKKDSIVREIKSSVRNFPGKTFPGKTFVIYFIDYDDCAINHTTQQAYNEISSYCKEHCYELVFFNRNVEEVFWKKEINNCDKTDLAARFARNKMIKTIEENSLRAFEPIRPCSSNILTILDKFFKRK